MITVLDKNTALVLIDLQKGILSVPRAHPIDELLEKTALLIEAFRKESLPIVIVNVDPTNAPWMKSRKEFGTAQTNTNNSISDFTEITDAIKSESSDILITKKTWNAFYNTPLHDELQKRNVIGIVLGGVATSIGVEATAHPASELEYIFPRLGELGTSMEIIEKLNSRV